MTVIRTTGQTCDAPPGWQDAFLQHLLPAVVRRARFWFRGLSRGEREEAVAEATAGAVVSFVRLLRRGKNPVLFAGRIAQVAVLRVRCGRLAASAENSCDVHSRMARQKHGFRLESLDAPPPAAESGWQAQLVEDRRTTPAELAISRIDFAAWLSRMPRRRRQIAETLAARYRTAEAARRFRVTPARIAQMRREFEYSWHEFQRDVPPR